MATEQALDPSLPCCRYLLSALLAMEPSECLISHARACGGGSITEQVQQFILDHCLSTPGDFYAPYLKNFLKKLIAQVECDRGCVLDQFYELYAQYITSIKDDSLSKRESRICKRISFLFPDAPTLLMEGVSVFSTGTTPTHVIRFNQFIFQIFTSVEVFVSGCSELQTCPHSRVLTFALQCSINMLEGDTGCSIWPSSLFLSELILSHPELFSKKLCFEIGSGVGLVGLCVAHVKASKVILSDGDLSTLANMKFNLELNNLNVETDIQRNEDTTSVKCLFLPWESASESQLQDIMPDVVLGADVIYDPVCLPHLVRLLTILLNQKNSSCKGLSPNSKHEDGEQYCKGAIDRSDGIYNSVSNGYNGQPKEAQVAYIACVIRNIETFNYFLSLGDQANLDIEDLTDSLKPMNLLLYMQSYNQADIKLLRITSNQTTIR